MALIRELLSQRAVKDTKIPGPQFPVPRIACPNLIYGIELEIERVDNWDAWDLPGFRVDNDGSLRNNGKEFISIPLGLQNLATAVNNLFRQAELSEKNYSERTSIHVHTNVQELTIEQLAGICFLYQVFEPLFFHFVGGEREKNIFCVPWSETNLTYDMINRLTELGDLGVLRRWMKYSALNLLPVISQGTIEFRQMPGHCDLMKIIDWCNLIGSLYQTVYRLPLDEIKSRVLQLNTTSRYDVFLEDVFTHWSGLVRSDGYRAAMEDGVTMMKYILSKDKVAVIKKPATLGFVEMNQVIFNEPHNIYMDRNMQQEMIHARNPAEAQVHRPVAVPAADRPQLRRR